ncbi:MAG: aconitate hydratase [Burkholderiaceae bacterium]|nr:MAG: aconitate hydratase [Burkholderiaceae bacterium]
MASKNQHAFADTLKTFKMASGKSGHVYSLPELAKNYPGVNRMPRSLRVVLESVLRHSTTGGKTVTAEHVKQLASWAPKGKRTEEVPFTVSRVLLQDFTGVPLLVDLAAMRSAAARAGQNPDEVEPVVPVDLVVDHSVMVDYYRRKNALQMNMGREFERNNERYKFLKWGMQAFGNLGIVPPGFGICHQVNLEYLGRGVHKSKDGVYYPDSLVGTDSHTPMINGIGTLGWGVGGIEAEAAMLGEPVYILTPDVVGVEFKGKLREGCTATDLVLTVTELLRSHKVVGKFVEYFGEGVATLSVPDRATMGNMSPEYGATCGYFPVDDRTIEYFHGTGRTDDEIDAFKSYYEAQHMFGTVRSGELDYSEVLTLDLSKVTPSIAGPRRPQDRIDLDHAAARFKELFTAPMEKGGFNMPAKQLDYRVQVTLADIPPVGQDDLVAASTAKSTPAGAPRNLEEMDSNRPVLEPRQHSAAEINCRDVSDEECTLGTGDVVIAAITSCTNTSNPSVMLGAGLLCKKAVELGLHTHPRVKTSLAPGSRVVSEYLKETGLLPYMEKVGFGLVAYGCTTCIGNSGDLSEEFNEVIKRENLVTASVLSGNRNFEARIHPNVKANFLMSPPLVVAYAIAGSMMVDLTKEPLGKGKNGQDVYLKDIWPSSAEINALLASAMKPDEYRTNYAKIKSAPGELWKEIEGVTGKVYDWEPSTYIAEPPFFDGFTVKKPAANDSGSHYALKNARVMALFADSLTTDHISPAGRIELDSPAGQWLVEKGVKHFAFNSFGSRRGNHEVMMRGTFANVRIKNMMIPPTADGSRVEGGWTLYQPSGEKMYIYDAAMKYIKAGVPTVVFAGEEYGTGSSRDWAAKGTQLLGIHAVIARSYERIHRSNLIGMGVMPLQFKGQDSWESLGITGKEQIDINPPAKLSPKADVGVTITYADGKKKEIAVQLRLDTPIEVEYFTAGGILPFVLRELVA